MVLDYVNTGDMFWASGNRQIESKDIILMQNVLWLADFFQIHDLQKECINKFITPVLTSQKHSDLNISTYDMILLFLQDAYAKLLSSQ